MLINTIKQSVIALHSNTSFFLKAPKAAQNASVMHVAPHKMLTKPIVKTMQCSLAAIFQQKRHITAITVKQEQVRSLALVKKRHVVVGLAYQSDDCIYREHRKKSAEDQIQHLAARITEVCEQLNVIHTNAEQWIIAMPEYIVAEENNRFLTKEQLTTFKIAMCSITKKFPKLLLIAGTIASIRDLNADEMKTKEAMIRKAYDKNRWIMQEEENLVRSEEMKHGKISDPHNLNRNYLYHRNALSIFKDHNPREDTIKVIRNTCYIFNGGTCIARHDKVAPYDETRTVSFGQVTSLGKNMIFQPSNEKGNSNYINSTFGLEICYEHVHAVLKHECTNTNPPIPAPLMHIILARKVYFNPDNSYGTYVIKIGVGSAPKIMVADISARNENSCNQVILYKAHVFYTAAKDDPRASGLSKVEMTFSPKLTKDGTLNIKPEL